MVKRPWLPDSSLGGAARDSAIAAALGGGTRAQVGAVSGGHQQVMDFRDINAKLPLARLAHPDEDAARIEVDAGVVEAADNLLAAELDVVTLRR